MAKDDINLLSQIESEVGLKHALPRSLVWSAVLIFGLSTLLSLAAFILTRRLSQELAVLENKIKVQEDILNNLNEVTLAQRAVKTKLSALAEILKTEPSFPTVLDELGKLLPEGVVILNLDLERSSKLTLSAKAADSTRLSTFLELLVDPNLGGQTFANTRVSQIVRLEDGDYTVSVETMAKL